MNTDEFLTSYSKRQGDYALFASKLRSLLCELLKSYDLPCDMVESRVKTLESLRQKLLAKSYSDPETQCTDLCGLRIILPELADVKRACSMIESEFEVVPEHSQDALERLSENQFGYRSVHFVAKLRGDRGGLKEYSRFTEFHFEIQVRTLLQHAWACINHSIGYKSETHAPVHLRRSLFRISALLEEADESLSRVIHQTRQYTEELRYNDSKSLLKRTIDVESLASYVEKSDTISSLEANYVAAGFQVTEGHLEPAIRQLCARCEFYGLKTIEGLDRYLTSLVPRSSELFIAFRKEIKRIDGLASAADRKYVSRLAVVNSCLNVSSRCLSYMRETSPDTLFTLCLERLNSELGSLPVVTSEEFLSAPKE